MTPFSAPGPLHKSVLPFRTHPQPHLHNLTTSSLRTQLECHSPGDDRPGRPYEGCPHPTAMAPGTQLFILYAQKIPGRSFTPSYTSGLCDLCPERIFYPSSLKFCGCHTEGRVLKALSSRCGDSVRSPTGLTDMQGAVDGTEGPKRLALRWPKVAGLHMIEWKEAQAKQEHSGMAGAALGRRPARRGR